MHLVGFYDKNINCVHLLFCVCVCVCVRERERERETIGSHIISCAKDNVAICNFCSDCMMIMNLVYKTCIRFLVIEGIQAFPFALSVRPALTLKLV